MAILNGWVLPIGGVSSENVCACSLRKRCFFYILNTVQIVRVNIRNKMHKWKHALRDLLASTVIVDLFCTVYAFSFILHYSMKLFVIDIAWSLNSFFFKFNSIIYTTSYGSLCGPTSSSYEPLWPLTKVFLGAKKKLYAVFFSLHTFHIFVYSNNTNIV